MTWTEAIDILHDGGELMHSFYLKTDKWVLVGKDTIAHRISMRTARVLMDSKSIILTKKDFDGITVHTYKINPKLKEK